MATKPTPQERKSDYERGLLEGFKLGVAEGKKLAAAPVATPYTAPWINTLMGVCGSAGGVQGTVQNGGTGGATLTGAHVYHLPFWTDSDDDTAGNLAKVG